MFRAAIAITLCLAWASYAYADGAITKIITKADQAGSTNMKKPGVRRSMRREKAEPQQI